MLTCGDRCARPRWRCWQRAPGLWRSTISTSTRWASSSAASRSPTPWLIPTLCRSAPPPTPAGTAPTTTAVSDLGLVNYIQPVGAATYGGDESRPVLRRYASHLLICPSDRFESKNGSFGSRFFVSAHQHQPCVHDALAQWVELEELAGRPACVPVRRKFFLVKLIHAFTSICLLRDSSRNGRNRDRPRFCAAEPLVRCAPNPPGTRGGIPSAGCGTRFARTVLACARNAPRIPGYARGVSSAGGELAE